jgi:hypothetical protein
MAIRSNVMRMFAWPMNVESALTFTPSLRSGRTCARHVCSLGPGFDEELRQRYWERGLRGSDAGARPSIASRFGVEKTPSELWVRCSCAAVHSRIRAVLSGSPAVDFAF